MKSVSVNTSPKLLIIDDDAGIRSQLKWGLDAYDIIQAESRVRAIELFNLHLPSLVTLDLGLPPDAEGTAEGFAILKEILNKSPDTKVFIVSGSEEAGNAEKAKNVGALGYFSKPVELQKLQRAIQQAYKNHQLNK